MTDFDPFDPWGQKSPWDEAQPNTNPTAPEAPVTNQPAPVVTENAENVTYSFKGGTGYDASLLVIRAASLTELNEKLTKEAAVLRSVLEKGAQVQAFNTSLNSAAKPTTSAPAPQAQPTFQNGQVQYQQQAPQAPFGGGAPESDQGVTTCVHGPRKHFAKDTWEAMFCQEREKHNQCTPAFKNKKTGKYEVKS